MSHTSRRYQECLAPGDVWPLFQMCHSCCPLLLPSSYPRVEGVIHESDLANKLTSGYISIQANKNQFIYSLFHLLSQFAISHLCLVNSYFFSQCFFQKQAVLGGSGSTQRESTMYTQRQNQDYAGIRLQEW